MPLQATSGAASYDAFGGGVPIVPAYIEEVFSTWLYTGTGSGTSQVITNGIDLSTNGGLVWVKCRGNALSNALVDTIRGANQTLISDATVANQNYSGSGTVNTFSTTGFTVGTNNLTNANAGAGGTFASWTFRKAPKFFDVVTYTGNGILGTAIPHNLGSVPGCIIIKRTDTTGSWFVYHRSYNGGVNSTQYTLYLNTTDALLGPGTFGQYQAPTSTAFYPGASVNAFGGSATYVAYIFAHNAGGFGLTGTDNVISCGSYTGAGTVDLGYEPQWVMYKRTESTGPWYMNDTMRGFPVSGNQAFLYANSSDAESSGGGLINLTSTGFTHINAGSYIYIAIRRGPMKVPTTGTSVFEPEIYTGNNSSATTVNPNIVFDLMIGKSRNTANGGKFIDRLRGLDCQVLTSSESGAESPEPNQVTALGQTSITYGAGEAIFNMSSSVDYLNYFMRRAPGFMDVCCYTGTGVATTFAHNLAAVPELMIVKGRSGATAWQVYSSALANTEYVVLNTTAAKATGATRWNSTTPTSTVFSLGTASEVNTSAATYVAYLFVTCPGVSKVGSYTGNGTTQAIACGFTGGARFVLIKRTDATGNWYIYDTARGMTVLTDPYWLTNSSAAESATLGSVITSTGGFTVNAAILAAINTNAASYIFLAIA